ncbi:MAG TPA: TonB-dependent siderophore myxochelin receptor MxcH [Polyangiaceae bacterium]|nr:TonB-dependent siderophore myxochelin receptor MxcH [Polyangiaceae bacterium]
MKLSRVRWLVVASLLCAFTTAKPAEAQEAGSAEHSGVAPPELVESAEAAYPEAARAAHVEGTVLLELYIDVEGRVTGASVIEPAGNGFDEAARDAALRFKFKPARRGDQPIAARIRYPYSFKLGPELPAEPAGSLSGRVLRGGVPVAGVSVNLVGADGRAVRLDTDDAGRFTAKPLSPGRYTIWIADGGRATSTTADVSAGGETSVELAATPAPSSPPQPPLATVDVKVRGTQNEADRLRHSAEAVTVVDAQKARGETADLGEVLARTQGVAVRRDAGLGSNTRFSLDGLYDDQIRFFFDGVPLAVAGFPFGVADVPVNLVDRVEIYRGVVPVRFGADALGGAVNLVSTDRRGSHADVSYQIGSFGTHRITAGGKYEDEKTGLFARADTFFDYTKNDYDVNVQVPDAQGRLHDATVPRFHDGYRAFGVAAEAGVVDRPWAERLSLRGFYTGYDKDLQTNAVMTVPYGEVTYGERVFGFTARYDQPLSTKLRLEVLSSYSRREITFVDKSDWVYNWYGERILKRKIPGEIAGQPYDDVYWQNDFYDRALLSWSLPRDNTLRFSVSPSYSDRTGEDRTFTSSTERDPLSAKKERLSVVSGLEWQLDLLEQRVENVAFAKSYVFHAAYEDVLPGNIFRPLSRDKDTFGGGDALRFRATPWLYLKASYEYATRLPNTDELFGNGVLVSPNLSLEPEVSHNVNVGPRLELRRGRFGDVTVDINGFWRESQNLIVLLGSAQFMTYQNVYTARSRGVESAAAWSSPGRWITLDGSLTYLDLRNASSSGTFGKFDGDRVPNRPWLFASFGLRGRVARLPARISGALEPFYAGRYVHSFLRGWESIGLADYQQKVPAQLSHDVGVTYGFTLEPARIGTTFEIDNVTNALLFDSYGAQRPGRAYYFKLTADI